jgi:hypothetical protein
MLTVVLTHVCNPVTEVVAYNGKNSGPRIRSGLLNSNSTKELYFIFKEPRHWR